MYKGNMQDFVDKVNDYLREKDTHLNLKQYADMSGFSLFIRYEGSLFCYGISDNEDFEDQVYKAINWAIKFKE